MKKTKTIDKYLSQLEDMKIDMETMIEKAQNKLDAMSEKQQESEKGEALAEDISKLEELQASLEGLFDEMETAFESE
jgi:uncharacterized coiled-coil protein SlyX